MKSLIKAVVIITTTVTIGACQTGTGGGSVSEQDALKLAVEFQQKSLAPAARSIDPFLKKFEFLGRWPCGDRYPEAPTERGKNITKILKANKSRGSSSPTKVYLGEEYGAGAFVRGNIGNALQYTQTSISGAQAHYSTISQYFQGFEASSAFQQAIYLAYAGDLERAQSRYTAGSNLRAGWRSSAGEMYQRGFQFLASATIERLRGNLDDAETAANTSIGLFGRAVADLKSTDLVQSTENGWWSLRNRSGLIFARSELSMILLAQGRLIEAEALMQESADYKGRVIADRDLTVAFMLSRLMEVYAASNRHEDALKTGRLALRIYASKCAAAGMAAAEVRERMARSHLAMGSSKIAKHVYKEMDKLFKADRHLLDLKLGASLTRALSEILAGQTSDAEDRLDKAHLRTIQRFGSGTAKEALILGLRGLLKFKSGEVAAARPLFANAMTALHKTQRDLDVRDGWIKKYITNGYIDLLMNDGNDGDLAKVFEIIQSLENGKVQEALRQNAARAGANNPELATLIRREQDLGQQMEALRRTLNAALSSTDEKIQKSAEKIKTSLPVLYQAREELGKEIAGKFPEFENLINPKPLNVQQVQDHLPDDGALIVVRTTEESTGVWAVPKRGKLLFHESSLDKNQLSQTISKIRQAIDPGAISTLNDIPDFDTDAAHRIYTSLLDPVSAAWKQSASLYVVAEGPLGQLPLSLLPTKASTKDSDKGLMFAGYRNVSWLSNAHAVTALPSIGALAAFSGKRSTVASRPLIGFGDPFFSASQALAAAKPVTGGDNTQTRSVQLRSKPQTRSVESADLAMLPRLPGTRTELLGVAASLGADVNKDLYLGLRANEQLVKTINLQPFKVIAFATHGLVPGDLNGLHQPALALSAPGPSSSEGDGLLTMAEILGLRLDADWAVLSACNTAAADGEGAEAISGLGRAFFYAGARALLVSNWPVHSGATTELMTTLFGLQAKEENLTRAEALRQTRQHLINDAGYKDRNGKMLFSYAHPIFWAPFTIVGDGR
jgi:CHAT domain-containing protein